MIRRAVDEPVTVERIERALRLVAYLVQRDDAGRVYVPIMDRLERELVAARAAEDPVLRARQLLTAYTIITNHPNSERASRCAVLYDHTEVHPE